jgi:putative CocE/NonD family hydrolase
VATVNDVTEQIKLIVDRDVMVPMRDGVRLATDIVRPAQANDAAVSPLPVIMERTPYDKRGISRSEVSVAYPKPASRTEIAKYFARHGFAVVMQDCRGRYNSEGEFHKYLNEAEDGYDMLEWLVQQPWCNGKVGTMGLSYGAHTQSALACLGPPGLACMFMDSGGFASAYHGGIRRGGAFELKQATWAYRHALRSPETLADPQRAAKLKEKDIREWFRHMPWRPGDSPLTAAPEYEEYLFEQWRAGTFSDYWRQPGLYAEGFYDRFPDVPTAIVGSWYDPYVLTCLTNFAALSKRHRSPTQLIMGPWTHGDRSVTNAGGVDFGPEATLDNNVAADYRALRLAWFRRWLKGAEDEVEQSSVRYFMMGGGSGSRNKSGKLDHGGRWRSATGWPPSGAKEEILYLHADGLLSDKASTKLSELSYRYDPEDPVPTIGGALTSGEPVMQGGAFDQRESDQVFKYRGAPNGQPLSDRNDVLVFQTQPLDEALVVSGAIVVELFVSTDCPDTDFTAKLVDVYPPNADYPEGFAMNIADGIFRLRYRDSWETETMAEAGAIYRIEIRPFAISNLFQAGHRVRLDISSSNFPHFDMNPNTGAPEGRADSFRIATNSIHLGGCYLSRLRLSVEMDH